MSCYSSMDSSVKSSLDAGNQSSIFFSASHDKRNLWWRAFRKTVLDPYQIVILDHPLTEGVPEGLHKLVEDKCGNLERHAEQASMFLDDVAAGRGFGVSPIFPPDVVPALPGKCHSSRCMEPVFDHEIMPSPPEHLHPPLFDFPMPRPGLVSGFSQEAFTEYEFKELPEWLSAVGTLSDYNTGQILPGRVVYSPYLFFERAYGNSKHELESSMNYCAMDGAAALNGLKLLFHQASSHASARAFNAPAVFSCIIDNEFGVINHHWNGEDGSFQTAPLCKFDFRDVKHFMHYLAWIESIEEWANEHLLPDIRTALEMLAESRFGFEHTKALPSPVTEAEKQEKLNRSMRLAFENIPWKGERFRNTPLGVTGAMRMKSPKVTAEPEPVVTPMRLSYPGQPGHDKQVDGVAPYATQRQAEVITPVTAIIRTAPLGDLVATTLVCDGNKSHSRSTPNSPALIPEKKRRSPPTSILAIKSATFSRSKESVSSPRPATPGGPHSSRSTIASSRSVPVSRPESSKGIIPTSWTVPVPRSDSSKSPGIVTSTVDMKSPSRSIISIASKKSFLSLRSAKSKRSPETPESTASPLEKNTSPRERGFKSKISNGLGAIKEHTMSKRPRTDNSAPLRATNLPMPTPAYDKKRFEIRSPIAPVPETPKYWADQQAEQTGPASKEAATAAYNASHVLPFRQYTPPVGTVTTTITAGGS